MFYDGSQWNDTVERHNFHNGRLYATWGASSTDIYAVGADGIIVHFDGTEWSDMESTTVRSLYDIYGISSTDIFAVGATGRIVHYDGTNWSCMESGTTMPLKAVWGSSSSDVYAVGVMEILHYDGTSWSHIDPGYTLGTGDDFKAVWGSSSNDVYIGPHIDGVTRYLIHYDGANWSMVSHPISDDVLDIWGTSSSDIFVLSSDYSSSSVISHYDGSSWTDTSIPDYKLFSLSGLSSTSIFAVGDLGEIVKFNGTSWNELTDTEARRFDGVAAISTSCVIFVGYMTWPESFPAIYKYNRWSVLPMVEPFPYLYDVWAVSENEVYAAGVKDPSGSDGVLYSYDGSEWTEIGSASNIRFYCLWGSSGNDIYVAGDYNTSEYSGKVYHYDGSSFSEVLDAYGAIYDIWGTGPDDITTAGWWGRVYHYDGSSWSCSRVNQYIPPDLHNGQDELYASWGASGSDLWVAGAEETSDYQYENPNDDPFIQRYAGTGDSWNDKIYVPETEGSDNLEVRGIWGWSMTDLIVVTGDSSETYQYDGTDWTAIPNVGGDDIFGISEDEIYVLGGDVVYSYDGISWTSDLTGSPGVLLAICSDTVVTITGTEIPPAELILEQNFPNPFNPVTTIKYSLPCETLVTLNIYDVTGAFVDRIVDDIQSAGSHDVIWDGLNRDGRAVASGIYFYRLTAGDLEQTRKMVLLR